MSRLDHTFTKSEIKSKDNRFDTNRIYMARVMDTRSVLRAGDMKVWVYNSGIDMNDSSKWITASYCSPFFGVTPYNSNTTISFENNPTSFGLWLPQPYVGNKVFIFFPNVNGENIHAYWFGCPMDGYENSMLPGIPGQFYNEEHIPTTEINDKNIDESYSGRNQSLSVRENARAEYTPLKNALNEQGLNKDKLRGYSTAGSKREAPSFCYGILTPLGNSFTIDDGWAENDNKSNWNMVGSSTSYDKNGVEVSKSLDKRYNAGFRLRTRNGTQILISDDGNIYMINRDGSAWSEITDDGRLMGYAQNSVDIACDGDINLHSKRKIKMEADEGFVLKSGQGISIECNGNIDISSPRIKTNSIISGSEIQTSRGNIEQFYSNNGNINGVFSGTLDGTVTYATYAGVTPIQQPLPDIQQPLIEDPTIDESITDYPTHEPFNGLNHNKNDNIPNLDINLDLTSDEYYGNKSTSIISNQVNEVCPVPPDTSSDKNIPIMNLTEHFTLADLCYSATAKANNIVNVPDNNGIEKLRKLAENVLEKVWSQYNQKVIVNSGYRGLALNSIIGGASSSQHCKCEAADIEISGIDNYDLACWIRDNLEFDQLILEFANGGGNNGWVHVSWKEGGLRKQCLTINKYGTKSGLIKS